MMNHLEMTIKMKEVLWTNTMLNVNSKDVQMQPNAFVNSSVEDKSVKIIVKSFNTCL